MDEVGIVNTVAIQDMHKTTDVGYINNNEKGGISLDKSFEDKINETYEMMMKNRQVNTNKAPVMYPLGVAQSGSVDVNPLARSSPKVTKFQLIKPKQEPSLKTSLKIILKAEPLKIQSPSKLTPLGSSVVKMEISSLQHYPTPFTPRSYTWSGLNGLQLNPAWKNSPQTLSAKAGVGYLGSEVATHSLVRPVAAGRRLLPKSILSINQNSNSKRIFNKQSVKFSPYSQNTFPPTTMIPMDSGLFKIEIVKTEETPKIEVVGQEQKLELKFPIMPSSWSARDDPVKMKKNEQERERRLEMAVYRESLRKMLPRTQFVKKVSSAVILQAAKDHCQSLQSQMQILESMKLMEEGRKKILIWRLTDLSSRNYLRNNSSISMD